MVEGRQAPSGAQPGDLCLQAGLNEKTLRGLFLEVLMKNGEMTKNGLYLGPENTCGLDPNKWVKGEAEPDYMPTIIPIYQTDKDLPTEINGYGCRFMSLLAIPQFTLNKKLDAKTIISIYEECLKDPKVIITNVNSKCRCGEKEHVIINLGFEALGSTLRGGQIDPWTVEGNLKQNIPSHADFTIIQWKTLVSGCYGTHFELGDKLGMDLYDPGDKSFDKFIRRSYGIDENDTRIDINVKDFIPERYLIYKVF